MNAQHTKPSAREALRVAIAVRDEAAARVREAASTLARAGRLAVDAQRRLDVLGDVDAEIAAHRAGAYKAWATDGGERPVLDAPRELAERQRARGAAADELAAARTAHDALEAEHAAAVQAHSRASDIVFEAAKQVLVEEADRIAAEMETALGHAFALHDDLHALAMLSAQRGGQTWQEGQLRLSPAVLRRLTTPLDWRPQLPGAQTYAGRRLPRWQRYSTRFRATRWPLLPTIILLLLPGARLRGEPTNESMTRNLTETPPAIKENTVFTREILVI
jgi:hypothetical protein